MELERLGNSCGAAARAGSGKSVWRMALVGCAVMEGDGPSRELGSEQLLGLPCAAEDAEGVGAALVAAAGGPGQL